MSYHLLMQHQLPQVLVANQPDVTFQHQLDILSESCVTEQRLTLENHDVTSASRPTSNNAKCINTCRNTRLSYTNVGR